MNATAKDLRTRTRALLEAVERGEEVIITYRGRPRARLVAPEAAARAEGDVAALFGIWRDYDETMDVDAYVRLLRQSRQ